jgi:signal transduction histidine kinase
MTDVRDGQAKSIVGRSWWTHRPMLTDLLMAVAVTLTVVPRAFGNAARIPGPIAVVSLALAVPLVWRRRSPLFVFGVVCSVAFVQWLMTGPVLADVAVLIAFYTVAATSSLRRIGLAALVLECGVVLAVIRYGGHREYLLAFVFLSALVVAAGVLGVNVRVRRAYLAEVEQRAARLEFERDRQGQLAVAAERSRIAREMHDVIAHNLTVMISLADGASFTAKSDPGRASAAMAEASNAGRRALSEMRRVLGVLRDVSDPAELAPAPGLSDIDRLLSTIRRTGLDASLTSEGSLADVVPSLQLSIYRLVQESLTNTVKHAVGATRVMVQLRRRADSIDVVVTDDGADARAGADPGNGGGHGIVGMRERAWAHNGIIELGGTATGWRVHARFPVLPDDVNSGDDAVGSSAGPVPAWTEFAGAAVDAGAAP